MITDSGPEWMYLRPLKAYMFEQLKENIRLAGETHAAARQGLRSVLDRFENAPRLKQAMWMCILGAIVVPAIASHFSIPWYYQIILVLGIVIIPLRVWVRKADTKDC